jgi:hypothetical protein
VEGKKVRCPKCQQVQTVHVQAQEMIQPLQRPISAQPLPERRSTGDNATTTTAATATTAKQEGGSSDSSSSSSEDGKEAPAGEKKKAMWAESENRQLSLAQPSPSNAALRKSKMPARSVRKTLAEVAAKQQLSALGGDKGGHSDVTEDASGSSSSAEDARGSSDDSDKGGQEQVIRVPRASLVSRPQLGPIKTTNEEDSALMDSIAELKEVEEKRNEGEEQEEEEMNQPVKRMPRNTMMILNELVDDASSDTNGDSDARSLAATPSPFLETDEENMLILKRRSKMGL